MKKGGWRRIARRILIGVILLPPILVICLAGGLKLTVASEVPFLPLAEMIAGALWSQTTCRVVDCEADLVEGIETVTFADDLVKDTIVALDVDETGRVFVAETARQRNGAEDNRSHAYWLLDDLASRTIEDRQRYIEKALGEGRFEEPDHFTRFEDRVAMLEDTDEDGLADRRTRIAGWNETLSGLVSGVEAREGTLWVTAIPSVHRIRDLDGDGTPETDEELHRGFGVKTSLGGHDLHGLIWGPDGKLYFSMGDRGYSIPRADGSRIEPTLGPGRGAVFRMNGDGSELEVFATGVRNPQELAFDDHGNLFTGDNNGDGGDRARVVYLVEGGETGWAMPYQSLAGNYVRGPWVAERLWELQHPTQPAWVLPPVAYIGNGPAGFAHYPGLGLPERYAGHFFLCDYGYVSSRSGVWSFAVEPLGASFEMVDLHEFAWGVLATDFDFGWDGRMYASVFDQMLLTQSVARMTHAESQARPEVAALTAHVQGKMSTKESESLLALLDFPDQRLRIRAQAELANRNEVALLVGKARDAKADLVARLHALWGLGQIGASGLQALAPDGLDWASSEAPEFRAQLAKVAGGARADWLAPGLMRWLDDPAERVQFFAAQSLGALEERAASAALFELLARNADADVYLRHAAVYALTRIGDLDGVWARRDDSSRSVRLAVLLVLRRAEDSRIAHFLADADPLLRVEAARAIYDVPIDGAMHALAAQSDDLTPAHENDRQIGRALHRRVIGANVRLRTSEGAARLARYAADASQLEVMRSMALEALRSYSKPPPRDLTMGFYRPLQTVDDAIVKTVFRNFGRRLIDSNLGARALEIATQLGELPYTAEELRAVAADASASNAARIAALSALPAAVEGQVAAKLATQALDAHSSDVRIAARGVLVAIAAPDAQNVLLDAATNGSDIAERQAAWRALGAFEMAPGSPFSRTVAQALEAWQAGRLEPEVGLEVLRASARHPDPSVVAMAQALLTPTSTAEGDRRWATAGGDAAAGRVVFQTMGDCQRCHASSGSLGAGHDAGVGPDLKGVGQKGAAYVLESILDPQAKIVAGFGNVTLSLRDGRRLSGSLVRESAAEVVLDRGGASPERFAREQISALTEPLSGMPPIGLALAPDDLRDLVAYVMSLD